MTNLKISVALFAYGGISSDCLLSHMDFLAGVIKGNLHAKLFTIREDALISRSRCRAVAQFLRDEGPAATDVLVMVDHDIQFQALDLWQMATLAHQHQAIVGIPYPFRKLGAGPVCRPPVDLNLSISTLAQVQYLGAGFLAVPRETLLQMIKHLKDLAPPMGIDWCKDQICDFWSLFQPFVLASEYLSEDYAFCERARECGVKVLAWVGPSLTHWGPHGFKLVSNSPGLCAPDTLGAIQTPQTTPVIPPADQNAANPNPAHKS